VTDEVAIAASSSADGASRRPEDESRALIHLEHVRKTFETPAGAFTALDGISLRVGAGEFAAVIGKSGSGKTTLVNMITGIDRPTSGEVWIAGTPVHTLTENRIARWRGRNIGVVFQFFQLLPTLSLLDNVVLPMEFCRLYTHRERQERAMHLLEQVGMAPRAHKLPSAVSGGQQQRVAIARALATDPPLLVADEPTGNLDSKTAESILQLFEQLVADGKTVLVVTHDNDLAARAGRTIVVADGELVNEYVRQALAKLDLDQLSLTSSRLEPVTYPPGSVIVRQGDAADRFYVITKGEVDVLLQHPSGQEILVNRLGRGEFFGEIALLRGGTRIATVRAGAGEVEAMALDRDAFAELIRESEPTRRELERVISSRLGDISDLLEHVGLPSGPGDGE
jgi:putative ABC transport system ATP-binding protein